MGRVYDELVRTPLLSWGRRQYKIRITHDLGALPWSNNLWAPFGPSWFPQCHNLVFRKPGKGRMSVETSRSNNWSSMLNCDRKRILPVQAHSQAAWTSLFFLANTANLTFWGPDLPAILWEDNARVDKATYHDVVTLWDQECGKSVRTDCRKYLPTSTNLHIFQRSTDFRLIQQELHHFDVRCTAHTT